VISAIWALGKPLPKVAISCGRPASPGLTLLRPQRCATRWPTQDRERHTVSAFLAAAALAQEIGNVSGYRRTGLLFVEPHTSDGAERLGSAHR
jgi:hypothetical protein